VTCVVIVVFFKKKKQQPKERGLSVCLSVCLSINMGNVNNNNNNNNSTMMGYPDVIGNPDMVLETYEYECPVDGCEHRIKDRIDKHGGNICGVPEHCCPSCTTKGWKHLSGHGGPPETWKEEAEEPKTPRRERVIVTNTPKKYVYNESTFPTAAEEVILKERDADAESYREYKYKCPVDGCEHIIKDMINKHGGTICGVPKHCCPSCTAKGWKHLSGHGGSPQTWKEEAPAPIDNV
jgi:hypothetical protein